MKTYRSSVGYPANAFGWVFWAQYRNFGEWNTLCGLRSSDARALLRWLDAHPECVTLRVIGESPGSR